MKFKTCFNKVILIRMLIMIDSKNTISIVKIQQLHKLKIIIFQFVIFQLEMILNQRTILAILQSQNKYITYIDDIHGIIDRTNSPSRNCKSNNNVEITLVLSQLIPKRVFILLYYFNQKKTINRLNLEQQHYYKNKFSIKNYDYIIYITIYVTIPNQQ